MRKSCFSIMLFTMVACAAVGGFNRRINEWHLYRPRGVQALCADSEMPTAVYLLVQSLMWNFNPK